MLTQMRISKLAFALLGGIGVAALGGDFDSAVEQLRNIHARSGVVKRDGADWRVTKLVISPRANAPLSDEIFKQIVKLTELEDLIIYADDVQANQGWRDLASLMHLQRVEVYLRNVTGTALESLVDVPSLHLVFFQNTAAAEPALARLGDIPSLRGLSLRWVRNSDALLRHVATLKSLEELDVASNDEITDAGITTLRGLKKLRTVTLEQIGAEGASALRDLPQLKTLTIQFIPDKLTMLDLSGLAGVRSLSIGVESDKANIAVRFPTGLRHLEAGAWIENGGKVNMGEPLPKNIMSINLHLSQRREINLSWLGSFPELKEMTLALDNPSHSSIIDIVRLRTLQNLTLTSRCMAFDDIDITRLAEMRQLTSLTVEDGSLTGDIGMKALGRMMNLTRLILKRVLMTTAGLGNIWKLTKLEVLNLEVPQGTPDASQEKALAGIASLGELKELSLTGTLTDAGLKNLAALKKLRILDLSGCQGYTDEGLAGLVKELPELKVVVLLPVQKP